MAAPKRPGAKSDQAAEDKPVTLKDRLGSDVLAKLKQQAEEMKAKEAKEREVKRIQAAEAKKAEQKRLENDFGYLLENSKLDWRKHK